MYILLWEVIMRNEGRQSYFKSTIKDTPVSPFGFHNKKNTTAEEVLGAQFQMPPFVAPQNPSHFQSQAQQENGMPQGMPISPFNTANFRPGASFPTNMPPFMAPQGSMQQRQAPFVNSEVPNNIAPAQPKGKTKKSKKTKTGFYFQSTFSTILQWIRTPNISLYLCLFLVIPVLFLLSIFTETIAFKYAYIIASIIAAIWLAWKKPFSDGICLSLGVTYLALSVILIINLITGIDPKTLTKPTAVNEQAQLSTNLQAGIDISYVEPTQTPSPTEMALQSDNGEAQQNFDRFMEQWQNGNIEGMLNYISPNWKNQQKDPANALFTLLLNRRPKEYKIENISGTDSDSARTVTMQTEINKFTSNEYLLIRFQILMLKEHDIWYVDPSTLGTNFQPTPTIDPNQTPTPTIAPRTTVTPKPPDSTELYYNPNGGKRYHIDPNCTSVNKKYLPLTPFTFGQLGEAGFQELIPCPVCQAPS